MLQTLPGAQCVLVAQSCLTTCDPMDCSPPSSSVHGILPARIPEWLPFSSPVKLPDPGAKPRFPALQADSLPLSPKHVMFVKKLSF